MAVNMPATVIKARGVQQAVACPEAKGVARITIRHADPMSLIYVSSLYQL